MPHCGMFMIDSRNGEYFSAFASIQSGIGGQKQPPSVAAYTFLKLPQVFPLICQSISSALQPVFNPW